MKLKVFICKQYQLGRLNLFSDIWKHFRLQRKNHCAETLTVLLLFRFYQLHITSAVGSLPVAPPLQKLFFLSKVKCLWSHWYLFTFQAATLIRRNCLPKMRDFLTNFPFRALSIFVTIVGSFTYNVLLERDIQCTCEAVAMHCSLYMFLPFLIILFLILWTDKTLKRTLKYTLGYKRKNGEKQCVRKQLCGVIVKRIFKALCVGALWIVSVFVDGDWYVCCLSGTENSQLACKDKTNITAEENVIINSLKNNSRVSGVFFHLTAFNSIFVLL